LAWRCLRSYTGDTLHAAAPTLTNRRKHRKLRLFQSAPHAAHPARQPSQLNKPGVSDSLCGVEGSRRTTMAAIDFQPTSEAYQVACCADVL
jgi:hypothetical protein